jgi:formylglycine-generating enzyme required for sulfatase activity
MNFKKFGKKSSLILFIIFIHPFVSISEDFRQEEITNSIEMKFRLIPAGVFIMGSNSGDKDRGEQPAHIVLISKPFYIGTYEVTQKQYNSIMGEYFRGNENNPIGNITWEKAKEFCKLLSEKEGITYRLPTEAEWEYACRAGTNTKFYWGDNINPSYTWYGTSSRDVIPVGQRKPNKWGLYDMSGNVSEVCEDWWDSDYYSYDLAIDPKGPKMGEKNGYGRFVRVHRGGGIGFNMEYFYTSFFRAGRYPSIGGSSDGFRCVREITDTTKVVNLEKYQEDIDKLSHNLFFKIEVTDWHKTVFEEMKRKERFGLKPPLVKVKMKGGNFIIKLGELRSIGTFFGYIDYENLPLKIKNHVKEKGYDEGDTVTFEVQEQDKVSTLAPKELKIDKKLLNTLVGKNVELIMKNKTEPLFAKITALLQEDFVHVFKIQVQDDNNERTIKLENIEYARLIVDLKQESLSEF